MATAAASSDFNQNFFYNIDLFMCEDQRRACSGFDKVAGFVNDIFCSLANLDVRFEFDPLSLDDCRCEMMSVNEYNLLCTLKQLPYEAIDLEGDGLTGAVQVRLSDGYQDSYEKACWEDVCSVTSSGRRYLNTKKIIASLYQAIKNILIRERPEGASIVCLSNTSYLTLVINLHLAGVYKINLLPTIKVSRKFSVLQYFDEKITSVFNSLNEIDTVESIQIVAKPDPSFPNTLWRITFNDLEKWLMKLDKFFCVSHCLFAVHLLQQTHLVSKRLPSLSYYNLQMLALRQMVKMPHRKDWEGEKLCQRLDGLLKFAKECLSEKANISVFTDVNIFRSYRKRDLKLLCNEFKHMRKYHKEILSFNCQSSPRLC